MMSNGSGRGSDAGIHASNKCKLRTQRELRLSVWIKEFPSMSDGNVQQTKTISASFNFNKSYAFIEFVFFSPPFSFYCCPLIVTGN